MSSNIANSPFFRICASFTPGSLAKTYEQQVFLSEIIYYLYQWNVVLLVIAKHYLYGTVKKIAISSHIDNMALFLFAFIHANILLDEISLDCIAILVAGLVWGMFFNLLIRLEDDLFLRNLFFVIALLECWFLTLILLCLCVRHKPFLLLFTAIMKLIWLIFNVLALAWARLSGPPTLLIMGRLF